MSTPIVSHTAAERESDSRVSYNVRPAARDGARPKAEGAGPGVAGARLGTSAISSSPAGHDGVGDVPVVDHRAVRYAVRRWLWDGSALERVQSCGKHSTGDDGMVGVKVTPNGEGNTSGLQDVATCGSVWACPVCSAKIATRRAGELAQAVEHFTAQGNSVYMVTLTMRHHQGHSLSDCWSALSHAWDKVNSGKAWSADKAAWDVAGYARVTEVTHGANGWHVHAHVLLFFDREIGRSSVQHVAGRMYDRWERALHRKGFGAIREHALDVRKADEFAADYLAKTTYREDPELNAAAEAYVQARQQSARNLAGEAALGVFKQAKRGNRTPFGILHSIIAGQRAGIDTSDDERLWREWERHSKGRRQLIWSRNGLRERVGLGVEQSDEEIAEDDELRGEIAVWLPASTWQVVRWEVEFLLQAFDVSIADGLAFLEQRHLTYEIPGG